jgi:hypothetical protein
MASLKPLLLVSWEYGSFSWLLSVNLQCFHKSFFFKVIEYISIHMNSIGYAFLQSLHVVSFSQKMPVVVATPHCQGNSHLKMEK